MKISFNQLKIIIKNILNEEMQHLSPNDLLSIDSIKPEEKDPENIPEKYKKDGKGYKGFYKAFTDEFHIDQHKNMIAFSLDMPEITAKTFVSMFSTPRTGLQDGGFKNIVEKYPGKKIFFINLAEYPNIAKNFSLKLSDVLNPFYIMHDIGHSSFGKNFLDVLERHGDLVNVIAGYKDSLKAELGNVADYLTNNFKSLIPAGFEGSETLIFTTYIISKLLKLDLPKKLVTGPQDKLPNIIMQVSDKHKDKILDKIDSITPESFLKELEKISKGLNVIEPPIDQIKAYLKEFYNGVKTNFMDPNLVSFIGIDPKHVEIQKEIEEHEGTGDYYDDGEEESEELKSKTLTQENLEDLEKLRQDLAYILLRIDKFPLEYFEKIDNPLQYIADKHEFMSSDKIKEELKVSTDFLVRISNATLRKKPNSENINKYEKSITLIKKFAESI